MQFDTIACRNSIATNYNSMNEDTSVREPEEVCDQIASLAISAAPESTGVTTFVQEACTAVSAVDGGYAKTFYPVQSNLQDVREYFRRPVCIRAASVPGNRARYWSTNPTFSGILGVWDNGVNRLKGVYGIRATVVLTLQVAATPFHQGLVCLAAQYGYSSGTGCFDRGADPCTMTNIPHVVLDVSNDTSVQLKLPFLYVAEYATVRPSSEQPYAQISLGNLNQIPSVAGMGGATYQIYVHLEDIELFGATPQSSTNIVLTAGRKLSPVTEEFEKDSHPFSSALYASSRAVSFLAKGVPSISSIGGPVSWALGKAAGVVRYFGYGKPAVVDPVMRINRMDTVGEFNTDVATASMVLAATAANTTSINTMVGASDVDEMSLNYITSRWSQICVFDYTTAIAAGTLIYAAPICPLAFWYRVFGSSPGYNKIVSNLSTATSNSVQPSHLMFAASSFKQWRGGIKFRFTFVKTKMHAGRVMVNFNPFITSPTNTTAMTTATSVDVANYGTSGPDPFGYSAIFDLKDGNVFEFKVPYVSPLPYASIASMTGAISMYIVNPLISSAVVASNISVVIEVAGDTDFELSNPAGIMFPVHNAGTIRLNAGRVLSESPEALNQLTMGEAITSIKQLIGIPEVCRQSTINPISQIIPPWYYQPTPSILVPATGGLPVWGFSYGGNWASCFSYCKGGTDVHCYVDEPDGMLTIVQLPSSGGYLPNTTTPDNRSYSNAPTLMSARGSVHARLPGFFPTARVSTWLFNTLSATGSNLAPNPYGAGTSVSPYSSAQAVYALTAEPAGTSIQYVSRNASDDAQLAMYIGPPPIWLPSSSIAGSYDATGGVTLSFT